MARSVTDAFIAACNAADTDECFIVLVTVNDPNLPAPVRLNTSGENQVSNGETYLACPIQVTLSDDTEDRPPQAKLVMDNIDRTIIAGLRSLNAPPTVTLQIVKASDLDTVEMELTDFEMRTITYNTLTIEGTLTLEALFSEPAAQHSFTPSLFPGLF